MKKNILRNVAFVSAIFIVVLSIMLITNYFQSNSISPLQTEVMETLKELNAQNADSPALQEQIRQLDLLARKAYFVQMGHLKAGVYILLGMLAVFVVCLHFYFADSKNIPDKEIDPIDEWALKTRARKYLLWSTTGLAALALLFAILASPNLKTEKKQEDKQLTINKYTSTTETIASDTNAEAEAVAEADIPAAATPTTADAPVVSKVNSNAFRGNNSNGISSAKGIPTSWNLSAGTNIAWKQNIPRSGYNSPVINGNKVFFTGADVEARELYCLDLTTGQKLWSLTASNIPGSPAQMPTVTPDTGLAASSVATNGNCVCAIFASGDLICADMNGNKLWAKNLGVPDNHYGYASSLLIFSNYLIVQYDNNTSPKAIVLDISNGAERWSRSRKEKTTWSSPIIAYVNNQPQLILMGNPSITSYNPGNGEQNWQYKFLSGEVGSSACCSNGVIYGASEFSKLVAINGSDGSLLWESNDYLPEVSSPVATKENVYVATSYGVLAAFDALTGKLRKEHDLGVEFYSSPMIADGKLFIFSNSGKMHILTADNEFKLLSSFETGEKTFATPAFTDGKIVIRTEKSIYCVTAN